MIDRVTTAPGIAFKLGFDFAPSLRAETRPSHGTFTEPVDLLLPSRQRG